MAKVRLMVWELCLSVKSERSNWILGDKRYKMSLRLWHFWKLSRTSIMLRTLRPNVMLTCIFTLSRLVMLIGWIFLNVKQWKGVKISTKFDLCLVKILPFANFSICLAYAWLVLIVAQNLFVSTKIMFLNGPWWNWGPKTHYRLKKWCMIVMNK
jgi:hypothetical protein